MRSNRLQYQRGFLLVEMLVYLVVMVTLLGALSYFLVETYQLYRDTIVQSTADRVGATLLNQLTRETREGVSLDSGRSIFGTPTGAVTLNTPNSGTTYFAYESGRIVYQKNDETPVYLTPDGLVVTTFRLTQIVTPVANAVRYEIGITYEQDGSSVTKMYRGLATLRQSYE